jgi:pimeloyl-ACP methyl ester carboxylesterase
MMTELPPLDSAVLPLGIRARFVENVNGLRMHVLEARLETHGRPCLLLHGFPELAYSWRKVMGPLAAAGLHVVAPDQRGYGRTTGWDRSYDGDVASFRLFNLVRDALGLVAEQIPWSRLFARTGGGDGDDSASTKGPFTKS